jgi:hypothetical protein
LQNPIVLWEKLIAGFLHFKINEVEALEHVIWGRESMPLLAIGVCKNSLGRPRELFKSPNPIRIFHSVVWVKSPWGYVKVVWSELQLMAALGRRNSQCGNHSVHRVGRQVGRVRRIVNSVTSF